MTTLERALGHPPAEIAALLAVGLLINLGLNLFVPVLNGLLFLDMVGTALVAISCGPWWGAAVGAITNQLLATHSGSEQYLNFVIVNVLGGLFWGYLGKSRYSPFPQRVTRGHVFGSLLLSGAIAGFICSVSAMYTRFAFHWNMTSQMIATLPERHLTDKLMKWAVEGGVIAVGQPVYHFLPLDVVSIVPDKIVSTALAAFLLFYFFPAARRRVTNTEGQRLSSFPASEICFVGAFLPAFFSIATQGYVLVEEDGSLGRVFIPAQVAVWTLPLLGAAVAGSRRFHATRLAIEERGDDPSYSGFKFEDIYRDILAVVGVLYIILLSTKFSPNGASVDEFLKDGIGITAFLTIVGVLPILAVRYFRRDDK